MIVVFSGVDGAGKSTQIDLLKEQIEGQGLSVISVWSRGGYTPGFELLKKFLRIALGKKVISSGKSARRDKIMSKSFVNYLWLIMAMLDLLILYAIIFRVKSLLGKVVICDRYLGDTFIDFSLNFPNSNFEKMWLWRLLVAMSPKPDIGFLFILPVEESIRRSKLKKEPFPDSRDTLKSRIDIYQTHRLFKGENWAIIDGIHSIDFSADIIKKYCFNEQS